MSLFRTFVVAKDDLINHLFIDDVPLNSHGTLKNLFDHRRVARVTECGQAGVDGEAVKGCKNRITVPFGSRFVVFGKGKEKAQYLFRGYAGKITFAKLECKTREDELTGLDGIFFSSWPGGTADENRRPGILSWCTSWCWGCWRETP
ncbi:MAG: hypothetical protein V2I32_09930 [Desulforhopalus sp.]|jgi:hypothetical protein|nr:hypothetical protein [Desulforhopalus sp.]